MVDQLPRPPLAPENVGRAFVESDHRTVRRTQLPGLDADRIAMSVPATTLISRCVILPPGYRRDMFRKPACTSFHPFAWPPAALRLVTSGRWDHTALSGARSPCRALLNAA